jgi:hypothetical protein
MGEGNAIFGWQFKHAHYMWRQNVILTLYYEKTMFVASCMMQLENVR